MRKPAAAQDRSRTHLIGPIARLAALGCLQRDWACHRSAVRRRGRARLHHRRKPELDAAVKAIGSRATGVHGDVANLADLDRVYAVVKEQKGRLEVDALSGAVVRRGRTHAVPTPIHQAIVACLSLHQPAA